MSIDKSQSRVPSPFWGFSCIGKPKPAWLLDSSYRCTQLSTYSPKTQVRDWRVKNIEGKWSEEKMEKAMKVVSSLIEQYQPDVLSIKKLHPSRTSPNLNRLVGRIKGFSKRKGLRVFQYSIKDLESFFHPAGRINKRQLAEIIASEYPILFHELNREKAHRNPYHIRTFEAVALGSICLHQLDNHR